MQRQMLHTQTLLELEKKNQLFKNVWNDCCKIEITQNGFHACRIFSFNPSTIPTEAYEHSTVTERF